jgi:hypothetical protein
MDQRSGMSLGDDARAAALPALGVSLLRLSVPARLAIAATASCLLWAAVLWALA